MYASIENIHAKFQACTGISTDTRNIQPGNLFFALKGPSFDGNSFAHQALEQGAKYVVIDDSSIATNDSFLLVEDSLTALQKLANFHRRKFTIPIIGITGSNGKTSTKELVHAALASQFNTLATIGNLNNHIGVPLTLLRLDAEHELAIIEMGANKPGDIAELCAIAEPDFGLITNIGKAHLEGFGGFEGVLKTKTELFASVLSRNGVLIYNADDTVISQQVPANLRCLSYGKNNANISGEIKRLTPFIEMTWSKADYTSPVLHMQMIGSYNFYNYLAAIAFGTLFGISPEKLNTALENYKPTNNRSQVERTQRNTLVVDCYNANPTSMRAALESFAAVDSDQKHFILGDMLELGEHTASEHLAIAKLCEEHNLVGTTVGPHFKSVQSTNFLHQFDDISELLASGLLSQLENTLILIKGSRGIKLEQVIVEL